ncbi:MAG: hypothetical protein IPN79_12640 [Saprospiraceae bacterium]|nr:hypothetical protein [Saprospiraceae bacterium]
MNVFSISLKLILFFSVFLFFTSCETEETDDQKTKDNELILGYWLLAKGETYAINTHGVNIITATLNPNVFAHEFLADGTYIGHDFTGSTPGETGTWKLEVTKKEGNEIDEGTLSITTPGTMANKGLLFIDADGSMKFKIESTFSRPNDKKSVIYLETKKYEAYPYSENWAKYIFEKQ